jgi:hypothetical protein
MTKTEKTTPVREPLAIEIEARGGAAVVAHKDTVRVQHRDHVEYEVLAKQLPETEHAHTHTQQRRNDSNE